MKRTFSLILAFLMVLSSISLSVYAADENLKPNPEAYPDFCDLSYGALYAHATLGGASTEDWQRWHKDVEGINFEDGVRYFFLPKTADDNQVEIYNNYGTGAVTIGDVVIEPYTSAFVDYKEGEKIKATLNAGSANARNYTFVILKSDAEASVYVNDNTNSYTDYYGKVQNTDLWSFLIQSKENSVKDVDCTIISKDGVQDTVLKKLKGRGNTNWKETDKKPFNLTFYDKTTIGETTDKKFSFVSNAKDSTLIRNSVMYDLADAVGSPYASDQSFVDFYVNGVYRGSYIACQKIDMGKNSVVSLKDESDDKDSDFNFLVEVDVWNYKSDVYLVSDEGYHVVFKTPDLDDYDETDPSMKAKYDYVKNTYQKLEDALYKGTLADIEKICDLESLAKQYLLQELGKNCDGGYTSTFFTYNAAEQKFYAAPLWDCDSCLGAVDCVRDGCSTSTIDHKGWTTRICKYEKTTNPLGQAFNVKGTAENGKNFEEICAEIWNEEFLPMIDVILGKAPAIGRLKSIDDYASSIEKSTYINYVMWDFMWLCAQKNKSLPNTYTKDVDGELAYLKDWTKARADWLTAEFGGIADDEDDTTTPTQTAPVKPTTPVMPGEGEQNIYFSTSLDWNDVHFYVWSGVSSKAKWPGETAELIETKEDGTKVYKATFEDTYSNIIFNNGSKGEQTVDISIIPEYNYYITSDKTGATNEEKFDIYRVDPSNYIENTEPTVTTDPTEPTSTEITSNVTEPAEPSVSTDPSTPDETISTDPSEPQATDPTESSSSATDATEPASTETQPHSSGVTTAPDSTPAVSDTNTVPSTTAPATEDLFGDADLNGKVNIKDATIIQKHLAKLLELSARALKVSDVNKDTRITISDVSTIQKKLAGIINW